MAKLMSLMEQAQAPRSNPTMDIAAVILASQTAMTDIITRNFQGEIKAQVCEQCDEMFAKLESSLSALVKREAKAAVDALPVPERVIERITERVEEEDEEEDEVPEEMTVQRKDGIIATVTKGDTVYDVIRNKSGFVKGMKPRV
jgi:non-canonical (house-cleaning) NTP pyrophosphatase